MTTKSNQIWTEQEKEERKYITKKALCENAPPRVQPINNWIGILFHGSGEYNEGVPPRYSPEKEIDKGTLVDVIKGRFSTENDFDHVLARRFVGG